MLGMVNTWLFAPNVHIERKKKKKIENIQSDAYSIYIVSFL